MRVWSGTVVLAILMTLSGCAPRHEEQRLKGPEATYSQVRLTEGTITITINTDRPVNGHKVHFVRKSEDDSFSVKLRLARFQRPEPNGPIICCYPLPVNTKPGDQYVTMLSDGKEWRVVHTLTVVK
jgi:hypothetical protein